MVVGEIDFGFMFFQKIRAHKRSVGGYFDKVNVHHDAMAFFVDVVTNSDDFANQMTSAAFLSNLSLA